MDDRLLQTIRDHRLRGGRDSDSFAESGAARFGSRLGAAVFGPNSPAIIHYLTPADVAVAWDVFRRFADKDWSFTDCTSYVVIARLGLTAAFSFDQHFRQFGTVTVVP